jgi:hypothetical protein
MKRFLTLFAAVLLAAIPFQTARAASPDPASASRETRDYQVRNFEGLDISWTYKVELTRSSHYGVSVEAPDFIFPYLEVEVRGDVLSLGVRELPKDIRKKIEALSRSGEIRARVSMPELTSLEMSGASQISTNDEFLHRNDKFKMRLSGATAVRGFAVKAVDADIICSGAAKFELKGEFDRVDMVLSGAVNGKLKSSPKRMAMMLSGAATLETEGEVVELSVQGSGAAKVNAGKTLSRTAEVRLSGAARCDLDVRENLSVNLSGAASCRYHGPEGLRISTQSVSRGASLTRF